MEYDDDIDPFEARLTFVEMLSKVTANIQTTQRPVTFAMRHVSLYEDLYQCILERMDALSVASRLNLLGVIDALCTVSLGRQFKDYANLVERDLVAIFEKVIPEGTEGDVNMAEARKIFESWKRRGLFRHSANMSKVETEFSKRRQGTEPIAGETTMRNTDILRRMDEDRERHKRTKEEIWLCIDESEEAEFESAWENTSDLSPEDARVIQEENRNYIPKYPWREDFTQYLPAV
ncbi:hypothetical protein H4R33_003202 [Dimargaris cristalligena]|nr:hypothetical protein H4R33_003202 [Dimargaris cristalligena]